MRFTAIILTIAFANAQWYALSQASTGTSGGVVQALASVECGAAVTGPAGLCSGAAAQAVVVGGSFSSVGGLAGVGGIAAFLPNASSG
jgi:hypothetical protein